MLTLLMHNQLCNAYNYPKFIYYYILELKVEQIYEIEICMNIYTNST